MYFRSAWLLRDVNRVAIFSFGLLAQFHLSALSSISLASRFGSNKNFHCSAFGCIRQNSKSILPEKRANYVDVRCRRGTKVVSACGKRMLSAVMPPLPLLLPLSLSSALGRTAAAAARKKKGREKTTTLLTYNAEDSN